MISIKALLARILSKIVDYTSYKSLVPTTVLVTSTAQTLTLFESVENFAFIDIGLYEESYGTVNYLIPTFASQMKVNSTYVTQKYACEIGGEYLYLKVLPVSTTKITISLEANSTVSNYIHLHYAGVGRVR